MSVLIDAHVHLHDCFSPATFLESARLNFEVAARRQGWGSPSGALMLTESEGVDWFGRLARHASGRPDAGGAAIGPWTIEATGDPCAITASNGGRRVLLVAGRQVVTQEGLEVLLLGTRSTVPDGGTVSDVLEEGARVGALRVIPWGAGKWLFGRGRLLSGIIASEPPGSDFFLGDTAGRPFFWPTPAHFAEAQRRGIRVVAGTDPLPLPAQAGRAGSFGFRLEGAIDLSKPAEGIKAALCDPASRLTPFGRLERAMPFVRNQFAMQRRKRRSATTPLR